MRPRRQLKTYGSLRLLPKYTHKVFINSCGRFCCFLQVFQHGSRTSSVVSTGLPSSSANRKHKYSVGGVRPVVSHESDEPRRSNTPGSFLGKRSRHPRQSPLIGEGGRRLASSRPAALSVSEGPIGIPVLFLCLWGAERGSSAHAPVL